MVTKAALLAEKRKYGLKEVVSPEEEKQLLANMPVQKIIGYVEMANVKIDLQYQVLVPRYETEELIYLAIDLIKKHHLKSVLDLGCGSGFIGIAIKKALTDQVELTLSDFDLQALKQSQINLQINQVKAQIAQSDWLANINGKFDLIVCNPPYLKWSEKADLSSSVLDYEPHHALFAAQDGLAVYELIENQLEDYLHQDGFILFEINPLNSKWFIDHNYHLVKDINQKFRFAWKQIKD